MRYSTDTLARAERRATLSDGLVWVREWLATDAAPRWILVAILIAGAFLRLTHVNWDEGTHIHPDERFLTMVVSALELPQSIGQFFDSTASPMSPYNKGYDFFVYGTLPIFIVKVVAEIANEANQALNLWSSPSGFPLHLVGYDGVHLVGRALSGIFDLGCVWLIYVIGQRLYSKRAGLLAALFYAFAALPLQQSHFFTVDTFGTFFALVTFYFAVRVAQGGGWGTYLALGASLGASVACRINLAPLAGIALLAAGIRVWEELKAGQASGRRVDLPWVSMLLQATLFRLVLMGVVTIAVFRIAQPYAFGGTSLLDFTFSGQWRANMRDIQRLIGGDADYPPGHQWTNRTPFVFPFVNMVIWGMGLPLGLTAWAGWLVATVQVAVALTRIAPLTDFARRGLIKAHLLPVAWVGGMFLWQGLQYVQSMRYLLPIYPLLALMAAWVLFAILDYRLKIADSSARSESPKWQRPIFNLQSWRSSASHIFNLQWFAYALLALITIGTLLWGWGFLAIYRRPLTRITASHWMYANVPDGSVVANEHWDDPLPFGLDGKMGFKPSGYYWGLTDPNTGQRVGLITNYDEDTPEKREKLIRWLNEADVLVLSSNRLWGSIPRLPMRYPMTTEYYRLLFEEKLGFELAAHFVSFPTIFGIEFDDTGAEEAFSVYDHPEVRIYRKTEAYSEALVRPYLDPIDLENTLMMWPKQVSKAPTGLYLTPEEAAIQQAGGTWREMFDLNGLVNRSPVVAVVVWLLLLIVLGIIAFPLAFVTLRRLADRGYGVSKMLGLLLLAWLSWFGPGLKVVPFARWWIALCLGLLVGLSVTIAWRRRNALISFVRSRAALLLTEEAVFLLLFGLFLLIRIGNPDLWHPARGGEKPMEFAYLNAVIRSTIFPPYDPWHAGGYLNYYYFGWVMVAVLTKLTAIVPWVAYNLAVPTFFALTGLGAFSVAFNLADGDRGTELPGEEPAYQGMRIGPLLAGLAGTFFVAIIGNLGNVKLLYDQLALRATTGVSGEGAFSRLLAALSGLAAVVSGRARLDFPNDWWFWNASRVIPDTINEFPFFTFTYADLHAHMMSLPLTLLALAAVVALVRLADPEDTGTAVSSEPSPWRIPLAELLPLLLVGFVVGALRATNTWDFPTYALAALTGIVVVEAVRRQTFARPEDLTGWLAFLFRAAVSVVWRVALLLVFASITFYPYTSHYATAYAGLQLWNDARTQLPDYSVMWGFFLVMAVIQLAAETQPLRRERAFPDWLDVALPFIAGGARARAGLRAVPQIQVWLLALPLFALAALLSLGRDIRPRGGLACCCSRWPWQSRWAWSWCGRRMTSDA
jgi:YYY domain-containing protein